VVSGPSRRRIRAVSGFARPARRRKHGTLDDTERPFDRTPALTAALPTWRAANDQAPLHVPRIARFEGPPTDSVALLASARTSRALVRYVS
jgi:hypothetical protein